jgi:hypothetical protein
MKTFNNLMIAEKGMILLSYPPGGIPWGRDFCSHWYLKCSMQERICPPFHNLPDYFRAASTIQRTLIHQNKNGTNLLVCFMYIS